MESYEVIIVGAGPGGLACATKLAEAGKKVLLLEKNNEIGPKICAGGLTDGGLECLKLPDEVLEFKLNQMIVSTPKQNRVMKSADHFVYTIDRKELGQWQLKKIPQNNATIATRSRVTEIGKNYVIINGKDKIGFEYLVGADGSSSVVRRSLGIDAKNILMAIQYVVPSDKYNYLEMYFNLNLFNLGYAWIFPHRGYASIGCGCVAGFMPAKKLREGFERWLKDRKIDISKGEFQAFPINFDYQGYRFGNVFLIGDAAGLASALTGGGIGQAVVSGEEVANYIIDKNYSSRKIEDIAERKKMHSRVLNFFRASGSFAGTEMEIFTYLLKYDWFSNILKKSVL